MMESESDSHPYKICAGCLSTARKLQVITDKTSLQMYSCLLDYVDVENHNIPLCYECMGRLNGIVRFKIQVKKAHRFLKRFSIHQAKSMTRLSRTRTQKYEWRPAQVNQQQQNIKKQTVRAQTVSKSKVIDPECVIILDYDTPNIDIKQQKSIATARSLGAENPLNIEKKLVNIEQNPQDLDTSAVENHLNFCVNNIKKDLSDIECQTDFIATDTEIGFSTANIEKRELDYDATNEDISPDDSTTWSVNVKNEKNIEDIKFEIEEQSETEIQDLKNEIVENDDVDDFEPATKSEFSDSDDEPLNVKKTKKKGVDKGKIQRRGHTGVVSDYKIQKHLQNLNIEAGHIERVILTWEEVEQERQKALSSYSYTESLHKCKDCIMGFNHILTYETHMLKHKLEAGDFECDICKTRFKSENNLDCHKRRHTSRWRCRHCGATYSRASVAADHISREHAANASFNCRFCPHTATSLSQLRIHLKSHNERQHCDKCGKSFRDKYLLKRHLFLHMNRKDFACKICDKSFISKRSLESHQYSHEPSQNLYCPECDMNYRNPNSFYQHLKYSLKHVKPEDMKFACEFCPHKFARPRRLQEHRLSVHLKLTPHKCEEEGCTFASASRASLRTHFRMVHRNQRFVRNHICHTCGKAYTTKRALDHHINAHTGARPYSCTICNAKFAQSAGVYNHIKLMHKEHFERKRKERQKRIRKNIITRKTEVEAESSETETEQENTEITEALPVENVAEP